MTNPKSRYWCFTLNNYTDDEYNRILNETRFDYVIIGKEVGDLGTPHLQGYVRFPNAVRLATLKKIMPRAHLEIAKGNAESNITYCSKEGNFEERGERPSFSKHLEGMLYMVDTIMEQYNALEDYEGSDYDRDYNYQKDIINDLGLELLDLKIEFEGIDLDTIPEADDSFICDEDEPALKRPCVEECMSDS